VDTARHCIGALGGHNSGNPIWRSRMLLALAVILLIVAIAGGVVVHPLLFLIAIVALVSFFGHRRGTV
jgi:hypothetical protein